MNKLNIQRQADRRDEILSAAQRCFVRSGFHQTSMQEICAEAGMSAGNLYRYFPSKEALIAGIAERDRAEVGQDFARADLSQGLFAVLEGMAHHHFTVRSIEQVKLCTEVMSEARRNPEIARISAGFDADVRKWLTDMFNTGVERGDVSRDADIEGAVDMLMIIADGVWWRRALDPNFRADALIPVFMDVARHLLRGRGPVASVGGDITMKASRITAVGLVAAAALWILSGHLIPHESAESKAALRASETKAEKRFRVAVIDTSVVSHSRKLILSGRTEAERKVVTFARTNGILQEMKVKRGSQVKKGDVIAILSDESREAQVYQAKAAVEQRKVELEAKRRLALTNAFPRLELNALEAQFKAAEAALSAAEAERDRGIITAPWDGVITEVSEVGTAAFAFAGKEIVQIVGLDPMLAIVEVSERKVANVKVGDMAEVKLVSGQVREGRIRYVSKSAAPATRTYKVEVQLPNADHAIPDGITAEVTIPMSPVPATRVPRSALVVSSAGDIGVRTVDKDGKVGFVQTTVVEDDQRFMWLAGLPEGARVIVQGQDFVREGNLVEAVATPEISAQR